MSINFRHIEAPVDDQLCSRLTELFEICFQQAANHDFAKRLNEKLRLHIVLAESDGKLIGFKVGYEQFDRVFFSWLGGVHPEHHRSGIGRELLRQQHTWCAQTGYREIQTTTFGDGAAMLILNLREGFEVYGTYLADDGKIRVQLRRKLQ
jgi:predicted GNAT superfamily acetyltransferase